MESCQCFSFIWSICGGWFLSSHTKKEEGIMLHIQENENEELLCVRLPYNGVANLEGFRAFLEPFEVVPWPFDFWDLKLKTKIPPELERVITLEFLDHEVNVIRSHHKQLSTGGEESINAATEPITTGALPLVSSLSMGPVAYAPSSSSHSEQHLQEETKSDNISQDLQENTSCVLPEPKHKIFLSHSGDEKSFVEQLCKDLEAQNHFAFFDKRSRCLPIGEKFATLILDAAKKCQVAVVVLSREYLSSKWPMVELVEFVRARRENESFINLFLLFYKAKVDDLSDESILNQWRPKWVKLGGGDSRVNLDDWAAAVRELRGVNGLRFEMFGNSEVSYREAIVKEVCKLTPADLLYDTSKTFGCDRICQITSSSSPEALPLEHDPSDQAGPSRGGRRIRGVSRIGTTGPVNANQEEAAKIHMISERNRRMKQKENFTALRRLVPIISKNDKASILGDAIIYIKDLQERFQELEASRTLIESQYESLKLSHQELEERNKLLEEAMAGRSSGASPVRPP